MVFSNIWLRWFVLLVVLYVAVGVYLYLYQNNFLYFPTSKVQHPYDEETFEVNHEQIKTIVANQGHPAALIYFGGNNEAVGDSSIEIVENLPTHTVYLVNYRGYGGSSGTPSEKGFFDDAVAVYDKIREKHSKVDVIGRSIGSGVAAYLSSQREVDKLVLVTPFDSVVSVAQDRFPIYPASWLLKDKYNSLFYMKHTTAQKILILLAQNDHVVSLKHSKRLIDILPQEQTKVVTISGKGHNTILYDKKYYEILHNFFR